MRRRYDKAGILALYPQAFFDLFIEVEDYSNEVRGDVEIVSIRGPLEHHEGWWCDSYEAIADRVAAACEGTASTIVLRVDSPGGELFGCFDTARAIRKRCADAGKRLIAYVEGCACSAGYALACAAEQIVTSETAFLGSIGVMITRVDVTAADTARGIGYAMVASGARKLDGNPHVELSPGELATMQAQCDSLAELFFELVAGLRGVDAKAIAALNAGVFHGAAAVRAGLADRVASFDEVIAALANGGSMADEKRDDEDDRREEPEASQEDIDTAREALERAAADGDERAQRALDILNGEEEGEGEGDSGGESASSARTPPAAVRAPASVSAETAGDLGAQIASLSQRVDALTAEKDGIERDRLLDARADVGRPLIELLRRKPLAEVREILDRIPKPGKKPAATAIVPHTRGEGETDTSSNGATARSPEAAQLDRAFGLTADQGGVKRKGHTLQFEIPRQPPRTVAAPVAPAAARASAGKDAAK